MCFTDVCFCCPCELGIPARHWIFWSVPLCALFQVLLGVGCEVFGDQKGWLTSKTVLLSQARVLINLTFLSWTSAKVFPRNTALPGLGRSWLCTSGELCPYSLFNPLPFCPADYLVHCGKWGWTGEFLNGTWVIFKVLGVHECRWLPDRLALA